MEKIVINMGNTETVRDIIRNVDSGWILSMEYDKDGQVITESLIKNT